MIFTAALRSHRYIAVAALALAVLAALWSGTAAARTATPLPKGLAAGVPGQVADITDGDTLVLDDGRKIRLVGIQAPKLPLGRPGFPTWPLAPESSRALETLALGRRVTPYFGGAREDRYGRVLAHLGRDDGLWLQGKMLARGMARVYTFEDNRAVTGEMYALERAARDARRGIWAHPYYRVLADRDAERHIVSFQLVEGRVHAAALVRGRGYINFGADWRTDFTITVPKRALATFRTAFGRKMEKLTGKRVRVRGWLRRFNGSMIEATHPEQIEVLEK